MKNKKALKVCSLLLALTMGVTGCGGNSGQADKESGERTAESRFEIQAESAAAPETSADTDEKIVLRYMTWEDGDWQKFSEEFIADYMEKNPNVIIQYEPVAGSEYMTKLKTSLSSGTGPDICWVDNWKELFDKGVFEPLDSYIEKYDFDIEGQNPSLVEAGSYEDQIYGLFGWAGVTGIYYNKELFDNAGVPYPEDGWTWDECREIAAKLTSGSGAEKVYGLDTQLDWNGQYEVMMWGNGARIIDENLNYEGVMNSDKMVQAVDWYTGFVKEGLSPRSTSLKAAGGGDEMFKSGKLAMHYAFSGFAQSLRASGDFDMDKVGVVSLPVANKGDKPAVNVSFTNPICINKDSKYKEEAFKFLAARVGAETQRDFCSRGWTVPATSALAIEMGLMDDPLLKTFVDPIVNTDKYVYPKASFSNSLIASALNDSMVNAISAIVVDGKDTKEALDAAVESLKASSK